VCLFDRCGVCNGDGRSCVGCDGVVNSNATVDACGVCGGNNTACAGCDGVPNSGKVLDRCGVCGGDGQSCVGELRCNQRTSCDQCNVLVGLNQTRYCVWCNNTGRCLDVVNEATCASPQRVCPVSTDAPIVTGGELTSNDEGSDAAWAVGATIAAVVVAAAVGLLIFLKAHGKGPLAITAVNFSEQPTFENPLYEEYSKPFDNPMYERPE
jgi:hypothetical protein